MRCVTVGFVLSSLLSPFLQAAVVPVRSLDGYFFPPPRELYYFRPDLYVYQVSRPYYRPRYHRPSDYYFPGYSRRVGYGSFLDLGRPYRQYGIYRLIVGSPPTGGFIKANSSDLIFDVVPARALVYIDGKLIGSAGDFASKRDRYPLLDGEHDLRIECPGYLPFETQLDVVPDRLLHLNIELERAGP